MAAPAIGRRSNEPSASDAVAAATRVVDSCETAKNKMGGEGYVSNLELASAMWSLGHTGTMPSLPRVISQKLLHSTVGYSYSFLDGLQGKTSHLLQKSAAYNSMKAVIDHALWPWGTAGHAWAQTWSSTHCSTFKLGSLQH